MTDSLLSIYIFLTSQIKLSNLFFQRKTQDSKITFLASTILTKQSLEISNKQILKQTSSGGDYTNKFSF